MGYLIKQQIRDFKKKQPKSWQDKRVTRYIRRCYTFNQEGKNKRLKTALAIYLVLTELESNKESNEFQATYKTMAKMAGVSYSTARRYCDEFIKIKVLQKEVIKKGKANQANKWGLLEYSPMNFTSIQDNKQTLLGHKVKIKSRPSEQNNEQSSIENNKQD